MKKYLFLTLAAVFLSALILSGCSSSAPVATQNSANNQTSGQRPANDVSVVSHSTENQPFPAAKTPEGNASAPGAPGAPSGNSPMARSIDVSAMTASIERLEKMYKKTPGDLESKTALADAYFNRAIALTDAAQYRAALGDFRKGLKLNPDDKEAKAMHDQIISIFKSVGREPPKEGEEPAPMPFAANK